MIYVFLICLTCCCSSLMPLKQSDSIVSEDHIQVVETKVKDNYVKTSSGYYRFGLTDLFSTDFLAGLIRYYIDDLGVTDMAPLSSNPVNNYVIQTSGIYSTYVYNSDSNFYYSAFNVSNIVMNKTVHSGGNNIGIARYNFIFSNSSPYDQQISINFYAQEDSSMRSLLIYGCNLTLPAGDIRLYSNGTYQFSTSNLYPGFRLDELAGGYNAFIGNISQSIHGDPYNSGYNSGYNDGYNVGYDNGQSNGYDSGFSAGDSTGYQRGYSEGISYAQEQSSTALTIFTGIIEVGLLPVNVFLKMFQYEVFGINIAGLVSGLITIAMIMILLRFIFGGKQNGK